MKRRTIELIGLLTLVVVGGLTARAVLGGEKASAVLEYQDKVNVQFTFEPTLSIDVSGTLIQHDDKYFVEVGGREYQILYASVTYFHLRDGSQVSVVIPAKNDEAAWAAVEAAL